MAIIALFFLIPSGAHAFQLIPSGCTGDNVTTQSCGLDEIIQTFIHFAEFLLSIAGSVAVLMFVYGGFVWLTSGGSADKIKQGQNIMVNTAIGIVIILVGATAVYSVGAALCRDDPACLRQLNIYAPDPDAVSGGVDCRKEEFEGQTCGSGKNMVCSYELRRCVTKCEYDADLRDSGYECRNVPISPVNESSARSFAAEYDCKIDLCPGDWDSLCCPEFNAVTECCKCEIDLPGTSQDHNYYFALPIGECTTRCRSTALLGMTLLDAGGNVGDYYLVIPGFDRSEPGCAAALSELGL